MIVFKIVLAIVISIKTYFLISVFISQFYDNRRMLILFKQDIKINKVLNYIKMYFFALSFGFLFYSPNIASLFIIACLFMELFFIKKIPFKFTRRSITLLLISVALLLLCTFFLNNYLFYALSFIGVFLLKIYLIAINLILFPYESGIRFYYIKMAKNKIKRNSALKIIAITGSFGKTSFKNYLYMVLSSRYNVIKTEGSINTPMGICKFINNNLTPYDDILILELGVDKKNTMQRFFKIFKPHIGIITSIGEMHLSTFKTMDNIIKEKMSLFDHLIGEKAMFYNADCPYVNVSYTSNIHPYSISEISIINSNIQGSEFIYDNNKYFVPIFSHLQLLNVVGVIKVSKYLGIKEDFLKEKLSQLKQENHRLSVEKINSTYIIDDSYNTNYLGLKSTLEAMKNFKGRKGVIINGVIELGNKSNQTNYMIGNLLVIFDEIALLSTSPRALRESLKDANKKYKVFDQYYDAYNYLGKKNLNYILLLSKPENEFIS